MSFRRTATALFLSVAALAVAAPVASAARVQTLSTSHDLVDHPRLVLTGSGRAYVDWQVFDPTRPAGGA